MRSWKKMTLAAASAFSLGAATVQAQAAAPQSGSAGTASQRLCAAGLSAMDASAAANVDAKVYPGAVYMISVDGRLMHAAAVGVGSVDSGRRIREDSIFRLASMSKPITAVAIMMLVDSGKIRLDDPVGRYVPEFAHLMVGPYAKEAVGDLVEAERPVTIRHLLTHTSGEDADPRVLPAILSTMAERTIIAARMPYYAQFPLGWQPGTRYRYSGLIGFDVLGRVVEVASGQPYDRFLETRIFRPLGMRDTAFRLSREQQERLVGLYDAKDGTFSPSVSLFGSDTYFSGGGGLYGTAGDYLRFAEMLEGGGSRKGVRLLTSATVEQMRAFQLAPGFPGLSATLGWGLGMRVLAKDPHLATGSFGWSGAFGTHFWVDPKNKVAAVFMINLSSARGADAPTAREFERLVAATLPDRCGALPSGIAAPAP